MQKGDIIKLTSVRESEFFSIKKDGIESVLKTPLGVFENVDHRFRVNPDRN